MCAHIHSIKTNAHTVHTFLHIGSHQTKSIYAFYNGQAADKIKQKKYDGQGTGEKTMYESHPWQSNSMHWQIAYC